MTFHPTVTTARSSVMLPSGWNTAWVAAKAAALAGTGIARVAVIGDSWAAGQSSGTVTDVLTYGWPGRLDALLRPAMGSYAQGYTIAGCNPGTLTSPSSPYGNSSLPNVVTTDGGIGQTWGTSTTGSTFVTITAPVDPVTNAQPVSMDLFTVDFNTNSWQYTVDGGGAVTVTPASGTPPNGVNGTVGQGMLRRTSITFTGAAPHTVVVQQNGANALAISGHVTYYGTTGLGLFRAAVSGSKSIDFATGGGTTASSSGGNSITPDHIVPWAGLNSGSTPAVNNIPVSLGAAGAFPFGGIDLALVQLGGNDCLQGSSMYGTRNALARFINALRRGNPATATSPGCSIVIIGEGFVSEYSDYSTAAPATNYQWQWYKSVCWEMAQAYGCAWIDLQEIFGEAALGRGLFSTSGTQGHPTQNGGGTGGGDGHLVIAQALYGIL